MNKLSLAWQLFCAFFKIGLFTFGGGYAMIPLMQREVTEKQAWIRDEELLDMIAVSEATPGPISINCATFIGYRVAGVAGAACATLGTALPSFCIISVISLFFAQYQKITWLRWAFDGIRAGVAVLIINAVVKLGAQCPRTNFTAAILILAFLGASFFEVSVILLLLAAAFAGILRQLLLTRRLKKQGGGL